MAKPVKLTRSDVKEVSAAFCRMVETPERKGFGAEIRECMAEEMNRGYSLRKADGDGNRWARAIPVDGIYYNGTMDEDGPTGEKPAPGKSLKIGGLVR